MVHSDLEGADCMLDSLSTLLVLPDRDKQDRGLVSAAGKSSQ
jgi:hypothetical protein